MRKIAKWALAAFAILILVNIIPKLSFADNTASVYYIKNSYTQGAYLYEANGVLRYGIPVEGDKSFQWSVEEKDTNKLIKNVATGDYITLEGHGGENVEGYWGEPVRCEALVDGKDTFLWQFDLGEGQNLLSAAAVYQGFALHLENATAGQPYAQKITGDQLNWGNMKWDFITADKIDIASMVFEGFCIQNAGDGSYLRVDNGKLTRGVPSGQDDAYIWYVEQQADGTKAIKNKKTGQYLTMGAFDSSTKTIGLADLVKGDNKFSWNLELSLSETILSATTGFENYGIISDDTSKTNAKCDDILSKGKNLTDSMKWNFVPSASVTVVAGDLVMPDGIYNLKNCWYSLYLIDDNGKAIYGNAQPSDKNAQWQIIYDSQSKKTALKNVGSGQYLYSNNGQLVFSSTETYYWNLKRHMNQDYPTAIVFQDSQTVTSYLHMESLSGFAEDSNAVQPTWGTPHWQPIKYDEAASSSTGTALTIPTDYIRLYSTAADGQYLYENTSGAVIYKKCNASDPKSHWKLVQSDKAGVYYMQNRDTGDYITNKGNGTLRCMPKDQATTEGSLWEVAAGNAENTLRFNNYYSDKDAYQQPYMNIQKLTGFAQSGLVPADDASSQWIYETAGQDTSTAAAAQEINVPVNTYKDTNLYKLLYNNQYLDSLYQLEYYANTVRILDTKANKYLYYNNGWQLANLSDKTKAELSWQPTTKAGAVILKSGDTKLQLEAVPGSGYYDAASAFTSGNKLIFTVFADRADTFKVDVNYKGKNAPVVAEVNGISQGSFTLPEKDGISLSLNKGINTISFTGASDIAGITINNSVNQNYRGASTSYIAYQAEDCNSTGTVMDENRAYHEVSSEASGRLAVTLDRSGQYVKVTLLQPANSLVVRYCIPDSQDGTGLDATLNLYIDGQKYQALNMTSKYSWVYGAYPWTNNPVDGNAHHFFDEINLVLDKTYPAGTVIKLQKDAANQAQYYIIDEVDAENIPAASLQPENSLSITDYGAVAGDGQDDSKALYDCIAAAQQQGKEVWIPAGVFYITNPTSDYDKGDQQDKNRGIIITKDNLVIRGAGMWYSVLQGDYAAFFIKASNVSLYDFSLRGTATARRDSIDPSAIETDYNTPKMTNLTVQNLWIEHYKTGIWTHNMDGMHIVGCRIRDTFADGMNLRKGSSNAVVEQCDIRNTGDDAIALWSAMASDTNVKVRFNTVGLQWLANNIAVYGGTDIEVTDNLLYDTVVNGAGVNISSNFDPKPFAGTITVARNTLLRCGSQDSNNNQNDGAIWFNTVSGNDNNATVQVKDNLIVNSTCQGISFSNRGNTSNVTLDSNIIIESGSYGIDILKSTKGSIHDINSYIQDSMLEPVNNSSPNTMQLVSEVVQPQAQSGQPSDQATQTDKSSSTIPVVLVVSALVIIAAAGGLILMKKKHKRG